MMDLTYGVAIFHVIEAHISSGPLDTVSIVIPKICAEPK